MLKRILYLLTISLLTSVAYSQVTTSSLTGSVKGANGQALQGATIVAVHQPSGTRYSTTTSSTGQFNIPNMRVGGPYEVTITYVGMEPLRFTDLNLRLAEAFVLDANMTAASAAMQEVVVSATGRSSVINSKRTGSVTNLGRREIENMPTVTRSLNDLIRVTPQATSTSTGSIGGGNYRQNYITVDGSDFNNTFGIGGNLPANGSPISLDALEEISINLTPFDVKQSGFIGTAINAVTRSGTNSFNGSVYTFFRSDKQQGNEVGNNTPFLKQRLQENIYGFRVGGPIIKNKLFFFLNGETGKRPTPGQTRFAATSAAPFGSSPEIVRPTVGFMIPSVTTYKARTAMKQDHIRAMTL